MAADWTFAHGMFQKIGNLLTIIWYILNIYLEDRILHFGTNEDSFRNCWSCEGFRCSYFSSFGIFNYFILFGLDMECRECGTSLNYEAHENSICFDCYCRMDLVVHEEALKKNGITSDEEE